jgi:hypothetical protein
MFDLQFVSFELIYSRESGFVGAVGQVASEKFLMFLHVCSVYLLGNQASTVSVHHEITGNLSFG